MICFCWDFFNCLQSKFCKQILQTRVIITLSTHLPRSLLILLYLSTALHLCMLQFISFKIWSLFTCIQFNLKKQKLEPSNIVVPTLIPLDGRLTLLIPTFSLSCAYNNASQFYAPIKFQSLGKFTIIAEAPLKSFHYGYKFIQPIKYVESLFHLYPMVMKPYTWLYDESSYAINPKFKDHLTSFICKFNIQQLE